MISETPTMAIEHVYIVNNTSVIQDEASPPAAPALACQTCTAGKPAGCSQPLCTQR